MKKNIRFYLPIEVKVRELDQRLHLAMTLVEKGFTVIIGKKGGVNRNMFSQSNTFIYFDKGLSPGEKSFFKAIKAANGHIVGIKEEGMFNNLDVNIQEFKDNYNNSVAQLFSLIFVWGKRTKQIIENHCLKMNNPNLIVTGSPALDLLNENLINYYYKLRDLNNKIRPGYILINTNFARANGYLDYNQVKFYNYKNKKLYNKKKGSYLFLESVYKTSKIFEEKVFLEFLNMIETVVKSFPNKNIIIRPHPAENVKLYQEKFEKFNNVKINREGSSKEWIVGAESVIHHDCTTGVEAFLAKKNVICFSPHYNENLVSKIPQDVSVKFNNITDLITYIKNGYTSEGVDQIKIREKMILVLNDIVDNIDKNATLTIAKSIENLCNNLDPIKSKLLSRKYYFLKFKLENFVYRMKMKILGKNLKKKNIVVAKNAKFPYLNKKEIIDRLNILCNLLNIKQNYNIDELEPDTFLICKQSNKNNN